MKFNSMLKGVEFLCSSLQFAVSEASQQLIGVDVMSHIFSLARLCLKTVVLLQKKSLCFPVFYLYDGLDRFVRAKCKKKKYYSFRNLD